MTEVGGPRERRVAARCASRRTRTPAHRGLARLVGAGLHRRRSPRRARPRVAAAARWGGGSPPCSAVPSTGCSTTATRTSSPSPSTTPPAAAADGAPVTVEARQGDLTELRDDDLAGASLVTASALLDVLTADELDHLVRRCVAARLPRPADPVGHRSRRAQPGRPPRPRGGRRLRRPPAAHDRRAQALLGPGAAAVAAARFRRHGHRVTTRPSPWRLDVANAAAAGAVARSAGSGPPASSGPSSRPAAGPTSTGGWPTSRRGACGSPSHARDLLARPPAAWPSR